jgi:hypothetical protein
VPGPETISPGDQMKIHVISLLGGVVRECGVRALSLRGNMLHTGGVCVLAGALGTGCRLRSLDVCHALSISTRRGQFFKAMVLSNARGSCYLLAFYYEASTIVLISDGHYIHVHSCRRP